MNSAIRPGRIDQITQKLIASYLGPERGWLPPERSLARELEVSRPLLREAIKRLQMQGYLEPQHGIGVKVIHQPTAPIKALFESQVPVAKDRQRQFAELRQLVEPQMAAWAARNASSNPSGLEKLHLIHDRMQGATQYETQVQDDIAFHRTIAELAQNQVLTLMLSAVADLEVENRSITLAAVGVNRSIEQHGAILQAIAASDPKAAHAAMTTHIEAALSHSLTT